MSKIYRVGTLLVVTVVGSAPAGGTVDRGRESRTAGTGTRTLGAAWHACMHRGRWPRRSIVVGVGGRGQQRGKLIRPTQLVVCVVRRG